MLRFFSFPLAVVRQKEEMGSHFAIDPSVRFPAPLMNTPTRLAALAAALSLLTPALRAEGLHIIPYQGRVVVSGTNFDGTGQFKFALVDESKELVQATANATVSGGVVTGLTVTNTGRGYSSAPSVTISGGGGSGATATASEANGQLSITLTTAGSGYTSVPTVTLPPPPPQIPVTYWSNDGTSVNGSQPTGSVSLTVTKGLFATGLGNGDGMDAIPPSALHAAAKNGGAHLRVWFSDGANGFQALVPDQLIAPAVYLSPDIQLYGTTTLGGPLQSEGGNARGIQATDLQFQRNLPGEVASGAFSFIGGGYDNTASGFAAVVVAGVNNTASGNQATILGGTNNVASGENSFAAGLYASSVHNFSFVWNAGGNQPFASTGQGQFLIRAFGGVAIGTDTPDPASQLTVNGNTKIIGTLNTNGLNSGSLVTGGITATAISGTQGAFSGNVQVTGNVAANQFITTSDRNAKESFAPVDSREILARVAALPIQKWNFKQDADIRHIGPMAQDFYAAFEVGTDEKHIATVDADGVALAAIQGLNQLLDEKEVALTALRSDMQEMQSQISVLQKALNAGDANAKRPSAHARKAALLPARSQKP